MVTSTITSKGQTTIPREVREALGLRTGDVITYEVAGDGVVLRPQTSLPGLAGALRGKIRGRVNSRSEKSAMKRAMARKARPA